MYGSKDQLLKGIACKYHEKMYAEETKFTFYCYSEGLGLGIMRRLMWKDRIVFTKLSMAKSLVITVWLFHSTKLLHCISCGIVYFFHENKLPTTIDSK